MKKNLPSAGFTLIELMTVIVIIGVLTGTGYISFRTFQNKEVLKSAVREVVSDIRYAQSLSVSGIKPSGCTGDFESVEIDFDSNGYDINGNCSISGSIDYKSVVLDSNILLLVPSENPVIFETPQGKPILTSDVDISLSHNLISKSEKIISISTNGNISE